MRSAVEPVGEPVQPVRECVPAPRSTLDGGKLLALADALADLLVGETVEVCTELRHGG